MFGQLGFMRLRAAEKALREGRLDEAFRIAASCDLKEQRRAVEVREALAEKFLARAREHFHADRFKDALADLDKAAAGHVLGEAIAELRQHVTTVLHAIDNDASTQRARVEEARRRMEAGSLRAAERILEAAPMRSPEVVRLREQVQGRNQDVAETVRQAERLLEEGRAAAAAERVKRARGMDAHDERVVRMEAAVCDAVFETVRGALQSGRLSRAADELACLGSLGATSPVRRELSDALAAAQSACVCVANDQYADAKRHLLSLQRVMPGAKWATGVIDQLKRVDDLRIELRAGPLGERIAAVDPPAVVPQRRVSLDETVAVAARERMAPADVRRLLLLVDGGGSYLVLSGPEVSIGRVAAEHPADVMMFGDLAERHATISRVDEDYFLLSEKPVEVGGARTRRHLLRDGDKIVLGRKAKLTFRLPSRQSSSAVLELSQTSKMPADVRRIVLMNGHALIGNHQSAHIQCRHAGSTLVLFERNGELWVRPKNDGRVNTEAKRLAIGAPAEIAGVGLTVSAWQVRNENLNV